jgi:hypothetical protein
MTDSAYLSRRLDLHPDDLAEAAARWHKGLKSVPWSSRVLRLSPGFWLASNAQAGNATSWPAYEVRGLMWLSGRPLPLILEFSGWSSSQSEVGVCPGGLSWPVGTPRYVRRVQRALELTCEELSSTPCPVSLGGEATDPPVTAAESDRPSPALQPIRPAVLLTESGRIGSSGGARMVSSAY